MASERLLSAPHVLAGHTYGCKPHGRSSQARVCSGHLENFEEATQEEELPFYKWRLHISYDGSKYAGWQIQQKPATVQLMLEEALAKATKISREKLLVVGASRTDTGVHALGQVVQFQTPFQLKELRSVHASVNGLLPVDIRVREVAAVQPQFNARYSAKRKIYQYKAYCNPIMDPFQSGYALQVRESLNINAMREAARFFLGVHDFRAFANVAKQVRKGGFVREIYRFDITEKETFLLFEVEGSGFLYRQVRNMVGLLLKIGKELLPPSAVQTILASQCRKLLAYHASTAPPYGLYLVRVVYDEADLEVPPGSPQISCGIFQTHSECKVLFPHVVHKVNMEFKGHTVH
eukprot:c7607_g1_i2 orf=113-1159(-)